MLLLKEIVVVDSHIQRIKGRFKHAFFLSLFATNHNLIQT